MTRGLISELDAQTLEATLRLIIDEFSWDAISITEVGLFNCGTSLGIHDLLISRNIAHEYTGIDNEKDKPIRDFPAWMNLIIGNSNEVYYKLKNNSQHLIFIDANHSLPYVISDFFCYADKVKVGGYIAFHDTGRHIKPMYDYQSGEMSNPDSYISVRRALRKIGLLDDKFDGWTLVFDRADETDAAGGICVFKKLH